MVAEGKVCMRFFLKHAAPLGGILVLLPILIGGAFAQDFLEQESKIRKKALARSARPIVPAAQRMLETEVIPQLADADEAVLDAMQRVSRDRFVLSNHRSAAYRDTAVPIGNGQTTPSPSVVSYMLEKLNPQPGDKILEIGTGTGYQAAILSLLVEDVYTIEILEPLGKRAAQTLKKNGYKNVHTKIADGFQGWPEAAPFDKIIVTCSPESIPAPLLEQLKDGGTMIVPLGERYQQVFHRVRKKGSEIEKEALIPTLFGSMTGKAETLRTIQPDAKNPMVVGGDFEHNLEDNLESALENRHPAGWHDVKNVKIMADAVSPVGGQYLRFETVTEFSANLHEMEPRRDLDDTTLPSSPLFESHDENRRHRSRRHSRNNNETKIPAESKTSQIVQGFAVDGKHVSKIRIELTVRGTEIYPVDQTWRKSSGILFVQFYNDEAAMIQSLELANAAGSFEWEKFAMEIFVPKKAKSAIVTLGLFDSTGTLDIDGISIRKTK